jgi:ADP-ribosylglycohydrolase
VTNIEPIDRSLGCLFGLAFGDALGAETEFLSVPQIIMRWPPDGPGDLAGKPALVTDDTQMMLAVGRALCQAIAEDGLSPAGLEPLLRREFIAWLRSPDNHRAPGFTCIRACERLAENRAWQDACQPGSKGCGANMRVAPAAFLAPALRGPVAQFQAALTHGHPTALAASDLTAQAIARLVEGIPPARLLDELRRYLQAQRSVYHDAWLGELWRRSGADTPAAFIAQGWDECLVVLDRIERALDPIDYTADPCLATGTGWVAEEAFATGLLCFLMYPHEPVKAIRRAAVSSGDSDSIACLAGAFAGAHKGFTAWPADWGERIEYRNALESIARRLGTAAS